MPPLDLGHHGLLRWSVPGSMDSHVEEERVMSVSACGICCDVCGLYGKGTCGGCVAGTDERAQMTVITMHCPILACAVEKKVSYCLKDCKEFPCNKFESGFDSLAAGPYPYSSSFLKMFRVLRNRKPKTRKGGSDEKS